MKKSRNRRRRIARLARREIKNHETFIITGRRINACKVEVKFWRDNNVVASVVFIDDAPNKQTLIRWYDHRYYTLRYGAKEAEPCNMTLAMWKTANID